MPRFKYTKTVYSYQFVPPGSISRPDYESYKKILNTNPDFSLVPRNNVRRKNDFIYALAIISIISALIGLFVCLSADKSGDVPGWGIGMVFGGIFVAFSIFNKGVFESARNEDKADGDRQHFYQELRKLIIRSHSYEVFIQQYQQYLNGYVNTRY